MTDAISIPKNNLSFPSTRNQSATSTLTTFNSDVDVKGSLIVEGGISVYPLSQTFAELTALILESKLIMGKQYLITDYQTIYSQPDYSGPQTPTDGTIKYGIEEPLIVTAVSITKISSTVLSTVYPNDIIEYDITQININAIGTANNIAKGTITYRKDDKNNITYYDSRAVVFKRYQNVDGSFNSYYPINPDLGYNDNISTFGINCYNNNIETLYIPMFWVFILSNNVFGDNFLNNTIGNSFYNNTIGNNSENNTIANGCVNNTIGNNFTSNTIGNDFNNNTIGDIFNNNTICNIFNNNTIGDIFQSNTIGNNFTSNTISSNFSKNTISIDFKDNTIGNNSENNTIGDNFTSNTIGDNFTSNTIGDNFTSNTINTDFQSNIIGNRFQRNTIGDNSQNNTISINFQSNTIGINFIGNTIGINFTGNTIGDDFQNKTYVANLGTGIVQANTGILSVNQGVVVTNYTNTNNVIVHEPNEIINFMLSTFGIGNTTLPNNISQYRKLSLWGKTFHEGDGTSYMEFKYKLGNTVIATIPIPNLLNGVLNVDIEYNISSAGECRCMWKYVYMETGTVDISKMNSNIEQTTSIEQTTDNLLSLLVTDSISGVVVPSFSFTLFSLILCSMNTPTI
jgi:hypothetical protein